MNYLLILILLGLGAGGYYYLQEQRAEQVVAVQQHDQEVAVHKAAVAQAAAAEAAARTFSTVDGHVYTNCTIVKQDENGIVVSGDFGIAQIPYWNMTPDEQKRFGYSRQQTAADGAAQARYNQQTQEAERASAVRNP
jgi:hypothetical protein